MRKMRCLMYLLCICLMCAGCQADAQAKSKITLEEKENIEQAFQEFLDSERKVYIEKEAQKFFLGTFSETATDGVFLKEIMQYVCDTLIDEVFLEMMETVQYAELDCGNDGKKELAVTFCGTIPVDDGSWTMILVYDKGELYLRHVFESWVRSQKALYYYGYIEHNGSGGAYTNYIGETVLDSAGRACLIYEEKQECSSEQKVSKEVFGKEEAWIYRETYTIGEKTYDSLLPAEKEIERSKWEEYCHQYEKEYGKLYTQEEVMALIQKQRKAYKVEDVQLEKKEPEWHRLENPIYRDYVKEIALMENRKEHKQEGTSVLKDRWVSCDPMQSRVSDTYEMMGSYAFEWDWRCAINAIVEDFGSKANIPKGEWAVTDFASYNSDGAGIYAVTVRFAEPKRELCLLVNSDAVDMEIEEYTAYIVAVDFQYNKKGTVRWGQISYDTMLNWDSFEEQTKVTAVQEYTVSESASQVYDFEWKGVYAMNQYLMKKGADTSRNWELDVNAVCTIGDGRMEIARYVSGEDEVVMALDEQNKRYAIIKGLDGD